MLNVLSRRLSVIKPLGAQWLICLYNYFKENPDIIRNGFQFINNYLEK